ncbi:uncharacterized protein LOC116193685 [Punica granatum]|uniref:Uncharacterized protein LOC116193685 n=1 Tax=Punica granatum TaxID=22663 RepID=A0A6P8C430_PUNGR|nr:uncharacterized protein LOC116193685 [Punica granatum]
MGKNYDEASALIEEMASSAHNWQNERSKSRVASVNDMDTIANLTTQISALTTQNQQATIRNLEGQISQISQQLSNRPSGSLPSNTEENPKGVNAIMLRSGKELEIVNRKAQTQEESPEKDKGKQKVEEPRQKSLGVNQALQQMPSYARFMKDLLTKKRKFDGSEPVMLTGEKLGLGECKKTHITLQLADRSIKYPKGIVENVLVKVDKFIFPVDFIVLEMEEDREVPMILGRPFLATGKALIDVEQGVDTMESVLRDLDDWSDDDEHEEESVEKVSEIKARYYEELGTSATKPVSSLTQSPVLELKPLPSHLKYAYLGIDDTLPIIISSSLTGDQEQQLLSVLRAQGGNRMDYCRYQRDQPFDLHSQDNVGS